MLNRNKVFPKVHNDTLNTDENRKSKSSDSDTHINYESKKNSFFYIVVIAR
jgi:hypothetical protein